MRDTCGRTRCQSLLLDNVFKIKSLFSSEKWTAIAAQDMVAIENISEHIAVIREEGATDG